MNAAGIAGMVPNHWGMVALWLNLIFVVCRIPMNTTNMNEEIVVIHKS